MPRKAEILRQTNLFRHLNEDQLQTFYAHTLPESFRKDEIIVREGEIGDRLFIIIEGAVRVFTTDAHGEELVLARLEAGNYFGEQALLPSTPVKRNASVKALTDVRTLSITHETFQQQLQVNKELQQLLQQQGKVQLLTKLEKQLHERKGKETGLLALFSDTQYYSERQVFFRQDDHPDFAYYLLSGAVEIRFYDEKHHVKFRSQIRPGQFFGEQAVLENLPRSGTAVALTDSIVFVISAVNLKNAYRNNPELHSLLNTLLRIYQIPAFGIMTQYQGNFLDKPAVQTTIQRENGDRLLASRVIDMNIFAIMYENIQNEQRLTFEDKSDHIREIKLINNQLVGVTSIGYWEDLNAICQLVYEKPVLSSESLKTFAESGKIIVSTSQEKIYEGYLCECMQVTYQAIHDLITHGITDQQALSQKTGAGSLCGGCKPRIADMLGQDAWTFVKIVKIFEHNDHVRSFQLQPVHREITPWVAGQHIIVEAKIDNRWIARTYTLTACNPEEKYYEITVKREPMGLFSRWLFDHGKEDMILRMTEPDGTFILDLKQNKPVICFMGGIGITPAIAFARKLIASNFQRLIHIDYSIHSEQDFTFHDELVNWPQHYPYVTTNVRVTTEQGHVSEAEVKQLIAEYPDAEFFVCGPPKYENAIVAFLKNSGISDDKIHLELFTNAGGPIF